MSEERVMGEGWGDEGGGEGNGWDGVSEELGEGSEVG